MSSLPPLAWDNRYSNQIDILPKGSTGRMILTFRIFPNQLILLFFKSIKMQHLQSTEQNCYCPQLIYLVGNKPGLVENPYSSQLSYNQNRISGRGL